jgi:hypothetical protein
LHNILERGRVTPTRHRTRWVLAAVGVAAVTICAIVIATHTPQRSGDADVAMIMLPSLDDGASTCGVVAARPPTSDEAASVSYVPNEIPRGYEVRADQPPETYVQRRAAADIACWTANASYLDPITGSMLALSVIRQVDANAGCEVPADYRPSSCTTVNGRPGGLVNFGARQVMAWTDRDDNYFSLDSYGFTAAELATIAESVTFDGTEASLSAPAGMIQFEDAPKTRSDNRDVVYFHATFQNPVGDDATVTARVTTWNDMSINETGPATSVDINGVSAVAITTGGPTSGIIGWTRAPEANGPFDVIEFDQPAHAYITWTNDGVDFRIDGPDVQTVVQFAQALPLAPLG